mgnify:CR=1 FL=1
MRCRLLELAGTKTIAEVSRMTGVSTDTLYSMCGHQTRSKKFTDGYKSWLKFYRISKALGVRMEDLYKLEEDDLF